MSRGFRWGRRPLTPRSAEPFAEEKEDVGFPTDWARTQAGTAARQAILKGFMHPLLKNELSLRVFGLENLKGVDAPVVFFSNHSSHLDATLILTTLPDVWQAPSAHAARRGGSSSRARGGPGRAGCPGGVARRVAGEGRRRCGTRLLLRRVVATGVHGPRVRGVPD